MLFIDTNYGWAIGNEGTILKTVDGGKNWMTLTSGLVGGDFSFIKDISVLDTTNGFAAMSGGPGGPNDSYLLFSKDEGATFSRTAINGQPNSLSFLDSARGWTALADGSLQYTADGGSTFTAQVYGISQINSVQFISTK